MQFTGPSGGGAGGGGGRQPRSILVDSSLGSDPSSPTYGSVTGGVGGAHGGSVPAGVGLHHTHHHAHHGSRGSVGSVGSAATVVASASGSSGGGRGRGKPMIKKRVTLRSAFKNCRSVGYRCNVHSTYYYYYIVHNWKICLSTFCPHPTKGTKNMVTHY